MEPQFYSQAFKDSRWVDAMTKELQALESKNTWILTSLPPNKLPIGYKWFNTNGTLLNWISIISFFMETYMKKYIWHYLKATNTIQPSQILSANFKNPYMVSNKQINNGKDFLALVIYVDDILLTGNNLELIKHIKQQLDEAFSIKDLGNLNYYLGIEFLRNAKGITMTQRKYALELLHNGDSLTDPSQYRAFVGKLLYLTITRLGLSYAAHCLSQFSHSLRTPHLKALIKVLRYIKLCPGQGLFFPQTPTSNLKHIVIVTGQVVNQQEDQQLVSVYFLAPVSFLGNQRSKRLSQDHPPKLNAWLLQTAHGVMAIAEMKNKAILKAQSRTHPRLSRL
ncbi:uncharacterized mitochondrial protein-like protein [Tanacetum coccineum]